MGRYSQIRTGIRHLIECHLLSETYLTANCPIGTTVLPCSCAQHFYTNSEISIGNNVARITGQTTTTINIDPPLSVAVYENEAVLKLPRFDICDNPPKTHTSHPYVTISIPERLPSEPMTISPIWSFTYGVAIDIFAEKHDTDSTFLELDTIVTRLENTLHALPNPILYGGKAVLSEPLNENDTVFKIDSETLHGELTGEIIFIACARQRSNAIKANLGNGVYELCYPTGQDFPVAIVLSPSLSVYDFDVSTSFGDVDTQSYKSATLYYEFSTAMLTDIHQQ